MLSHMCLVMWWPIQTTTIMIRDGGNQHYFENAFLPLKRAVQPHVFPCCRVGYLTLFTGQQNKNGSDPASVYEEYKKFDGLLTKMARGTLKSGEDAEQTWRNPY